MDRHCEIGVLTYRVKHRKTYDLLCLLKAKGYDRVTVYASPFTYRKTFVPLIEHRPVLNYEIPEISSLCDNFDYEFVEGTLNEFVIPKDRILLVAGAGLLPEEFVKTYTIINAHPGYVPNSRGLDALKWAIAEGEPIGVTTHLLGEYVDAGEVIDRRIVSRHKNDTFHGLAQRVYETEIGMLAEAVEKFQKDGTEFIGPGGYPIHKRMPKDVEETLLAKFEIGNCETD